MKRKKRKSPKLTGKTERSFSVYSQYLKDVKQYPLLSKSKEEKLFKMFQSGDKKALATIICSNLRFVIKVAFIFKGHGLPIDDLISEGNIGLIKAAKRYNSDKNVRFTSYAVWWIRQSIVQAIHEKSRLIRISAESERILTQINRYNASTVQAIGGSQKIDTRELSEKLGVSIKKLNKILQLNRSPKSLDNPKFTDSDSPYIENIIDHSFDPPDKNVHKNSLSSYLHKALDKLDPKEKKVIKYTFGFDANKTMTLQESGDMVGLSKERVRQIKAGALLKLKNMQLEKEALYAA